MEMPLCPQHNVAFVAIEGYGIWVCPEDGCPHATTEAAYWDKYDRERGTLTEWAKPVQGVSLGEAALIAELRDVKHMVFQHLLPLLVVNPDDQNIISQLVHCGERIAYINVNQPLLYLERKKEVAHQQRMLEQEQAAAKRKKEAQANHKKAKRDFYAKKHPADYISTAVKNEVNRQLRSNGGIIRLESGDGK